MKYFFYLFGALFIQLNTTAFAAVPEPIEQFQIRSYDPQKSGLTDLVFEARIEKLTEILNQTQNFGKLIDVYYKIYWISPSQYNIEIMGLPKGFVEVRSDLTALMKGKLEFIIPESISQKLASYKMNVTSLNDGKLIRAIDETYTLSVPEIDIKFDNSSKLVSVETKAPYSNVVTEFFHSPKSWSNNKLVLDKTVAVSTQGPTYNRITNSIEYASVAGFGLPQKLTISNFTEVTIPAQGKSKEKKVKNETTTVIKFSKYEVNTGKAQRFIKEGLRR